jgi:hypothetical protein
MAPDPPGAKHLEDPQFLRWLVRNHPPPVEPDAVDFAHVRAWRHSDPITDDELVRCYRLAQVAKLVRLWGAWKAQQN